MGPGKASGRCPFYTSDARVADKCASRLRSLWKPIRLRHFHQHPSGHPSDTPTLSVIYNQLISNQFRTNWCNFIGLLGQLLYWGQASGSVDGLAEFGAKFLYLGVWNLRSLEGMLVRVHRWIDVWLLGPRPARLLLRILDWKEVSVVSNWVVFLR